LLSQNQLAIDVANKSKRAEALERIEERRVGKSESKAKPCNLLFLIQTLRAAREQSLKRIP